MSLEVEPLAIPEVKLLRPRVHADPRGFFLEVFKASAFEAAGLPDRFVQDNLSHSRRWVLRGLHYQVPPFAQGKLVMCVQGRIFDVAVDLRRHSSTFGQWVARELSDDSPALLWIPPGFAHGFLVLSETARVWYKVSGHEYAPAYERRIRWNDPDLAIAWPLPPGVAPILSAKDAAAPLFRDADLGF